MTPAEIGWRLSRATATVLGRSDRIIDASTPRLTEQGWTDARVRFVTAEGRPVLFDRARVREIEDRHPEMAEALIAAADRAARMRFAYFGYPLVALPRPVDWNFDPVAGVRWPTEPGHTLDYRTAAGDVKWIWELNRLQHLPWLAQAWLMTGDDRFSHAAFDHIDSWIEQNPRGAGIAWRNAFEVGIRAISIALAVQGMRDSSLLTVERYRRISRLMAESAAVCWAERSRFSSANNHLVGEMAGLAVVAMLFPELPLSRDWEARAIRVLEVEAERQILADGAGAEQAVGYQMFTAELMLVVVSLLLERDGRAPAAMMAAIDRSAAFLSAVVGAADPDPRDGDNDEGFALRIGSAPVRTVRDHLGMVSAVTHNDYPQAGDTLDAAWLTQLHLQAPEDRSTGRTALTTVGRSHYAPSGGVVVLRGGDRRVVMDVGPLGYLSIAAHGHADALSVSLTVDGRELIGDPGAGSYYGQPEWRQVNRGTRVHATVEIDGQDQSVIRGPFMWSHHAQTHVRQVDLENGIVDAEHYGYCRLDHPVTHRRWLAMLDDDDAVLVVDLLSGTGHHQVRTSWPLHPSLDAVDVPDGHLLVRDGQPVCHVASAATAARTIEQVRGDESGHLGWWSDRLEAREPAWLIGAASATTLPVVFATIMQPVRSGERVSSPAVIHRGGKIEVTWTTADGDRRALIDTTLAGSVSVETLPTFMFAMSKKI